jgi:hypothetical protein
MGNDLPVYRCVSLDVNGVGKRDYGPENIASLVLVFGGFADGGDAGKTGSFFYLVNKDAERWDVVAESVGPYFQYINADFLQFADAAYVEELVDDGDDARDFAEGDGADG